MRNKCFLFRIFLIASLLVWGLYTKAHPGYDMFLCGRKIGTVKNRTQAEDILDIIRHETQKENLPASLYLRFFRSSESMDTAILLENARQVSGAKDAIEVSTTITASPAEATPPPLPPGVGSGTFQSPLGTFWVSSPFGTRDGRIHEGVDMAADAGTPVLSADSGTVIFSGECAGYGNLIILDHKNGFTTYYAHCSLLCTSLGEMPQKGDVIGKVGSTGNSTGPHLHFEIRKEDVPLDPLPYLSDTLT